MRSKLPPRLQKFTTKGALVKLPLLPFALIAICIFALLRPFVITQIYKVHDWRIGHMVSTTQRTMYEIKEWNSLHLRKKIIIYFFGSKKPSNEIYKSILMRQNYSISGHWGFILFYVSSFFKFLVLNSDPSVLDRSGLFVKYSVGTVFNKSETCEGERFLESCQLDQVKRYVCLNVRDSSYLSTNRKKDFSKHNLRNSDINTYIDVVKTLTGLGYTVFRMGSNIEKRLDFEHPLFYDYASNGMRTEFLDIFLAANCTFCISTGTGWDEIPQIFRRPTLYVNVVPLVAPSILTRDLLLFPKYLKFKNTNKLLSLKDCFASDLWGQANPYWVDKYHGVVQDLSSDDLTHATLEMVARVEGRFNPTIKEIQMQDLLIRKLTDKSKFQPSEGYFPIRAKFATRFLMQNPNFLD